ncbi:hypothetical protein EW145_g223 [Phellinidium pouzarii]|uniref:F-box domain-containing protein n=1 Tax=Phellinidium pouzarii TaxID=167371 RepID=A0A4S4LPQ4_9AGAM|nr:hypothetical protein EW145_g223 [Phellinidium pouzarii]
MKHGRHMATTNDVRTAHRLPKTEVYVLITSRPPRGHPAQHVNAEISTKYVQTHLGRGGVLKLSSKSRPASSRPKPVSKSQPAESDSKMHTVTTSQSCQKRPASPVPAAIAALRPKRSKLEPWCVMASSQLTLDSENIQHTDLCFPRLQRISLKRFGHADTANRTDEGRDAPKGKAVFEEEARNETSGPVGVKTSQPPSSTHSNTVHNPWAVVRSDSSPLKLKLRLTPNFTAVTYFPTTSSDSKDDDRIHGRVYPRVRLIVRPQAPAPSVSTESEEVTAHASSSSGVSDEGLPTPDSSLQELPEVVSLDEQTESSGPGKNVEGVLRPAFEWTAGKGKQKWAGGSFGGSQDGLESCNADFDNYSSAGENRGEYCGETETRIQSEKKCTMCAAWLKCLRTSSGPSRLKSAASDECERCRTVGLGVRDARENEVEDVNGEDMSSQETLGSTNQLPIMSKNASSDDPDASATDNNIDVDVDASPRHPSPADTIDSMDTINSTPSSPSLSDSSTIPDFYEINEIPHGYPDASRADAYARELVALGLYVPFPDGFKYLSAVSVQQKKRAKMLSDFVDDVVVQICTLLTVKDILSLRLTSKRLAFITRLRSVWHTALTHVLQENLPLRWFPSPSADTEALSSQHTFDHLSALDLERITCAAVDEAKRWERGEDSREHLRRVKVDVGLRELQFLDIRSAAERKRAVFNDDEGRYLLSFLHRSNLDISIWDLNVDSGVMVVGIWAVSGEQPSLAIDEGNGVREAFGEGFEDVKGTLVAVSWKTDIARWLYYVRILSFMPSRSSSRLREFKSFGLHVPTKVWALHGRLIALHVRSEGVERLKIVDWVQSSEIKSGTAENEGADNDSRSEVSVELSPSESYKNASILRVFFVHDWVLVFSRSALKMYFLPPSVLSPTPSGRQILYPSTVHKWGRYINSIAVTERVSWAHERASATCTTCSGSGYIFTGKDAANTIAEEGQRLVCVCQYRPISIAMRIEGSSTYDSFILRYVLHTSPCANVFDKTLQLQPHPPYVTPPVLAHKLDSYTRSPAMFTMGRFGTVAWIDNVPCKHRGNKALSYHNYDDGESDSDCDNQPLAYDDEERAAGCRLPLLIPTLDSTLVSASGPHTEETVAKPGRVYIQGATTVFDSREPSWRRETVRKRKEWKRFDNQWCAVAVCERAGRIVLGEPHGMNIFDHFDISYDHPDTPDDDASDNDASDGDALDDGASDDDALDDGAV